MKAHAKLNLALVVGPTRDDGRHEVATVMVKLDLCDEVTVQPASELRVTGFPEDTLVRRALTELTSEPRWHVHIDKHIPVAAGLGGGSSDAATALRLAADSGADLHAIAARVGTDVPFFLRDGPQLGTGAGDELAPVDLALDFHVVLVVPHDVHKESTRAVYERFAGRDGFAARRDAVLAALAARNLEALPPNDLARSPLAAELRAAGAFRADVSGAGPTVYGLFSAEREARSAGDTLERFGRVWITKPAW